MSEEERDFISEEELGDALTQFKDSIHKGRKKYFDVSQFESIVDRLMEEGDMKSSEIAALQGLQIHPDAVGLKLKYGQVLLSKGHYKQAMKYLDLAEQIEENNPDVHLIKGSAWLIMGEDRAAEKSFGKALQMAGSEEDDILYHIGAAYVQAGEVKKAIGYFEKALQKNPTNETALYELGFFSDMRGDYQKSIDYYNRYLDIDPFNYSTWFNLGITFNKAGDYKKAIDAYEYVLALDENFDQALFNIGNAHANNGEYIKAIKKYIEFLEIQPDNDDAYCYIGECYLNLQDYRKAEIYYQEAIKLNKENESAWFGAGLIMWIEKKYAESVIFIKKALKIDNSNPEYWLTLARVYNDDNQPKEAEKAVKKAAKLEPENSEIWLTAADVYEKFGEKENALSIMQTGVKKNNDVQLKYRLVGLLLECKQEEEAYKWLRKSLVQDDLKVDYLYEMYPNAKKNKRVSKIISRFKKLNN
jgi:tetratricopeptide (TPR) repeat protein